MSSALAFLAYAFDEHETKESTSARVRASEDHLEPLYRSSLQRTWAGSATTGFIGWRPTDSHEHWEPYTVLDGQGVAWLHIPGFAGGPENAGTEQALGNDLFDGRVTADRMGAPCAAARWKQGTLEIANDMFGLVRLFHYRFRGGQIWTTRQGLAHVFMGVEPQANRAALAGMAALGWATNGFTQVGNGRHVPGGTRVRAYETRRGCKVNVDETFEAWFRNARTSDAPSPAATIESMAESMDTSRRWPDRSVADLSGGKDSRLVAAVGIRSGSIDTVRTVRTDHGEVSTAEELVALTNGRVKHVIVDRTMPSEATHSFPERLVSQHRIYEGRYLATSAFNGKFFDGFKSARSARLNGLGGESLAGGNFVDRWKERLTGAPASFATTRLSATIASSIAVNEHAKRIVIDGLQYYQRLAGRLDIRTAFGVLDLFYNRDRMPHWSVPLVRPSTILPLFSGQALTVAVQNVGSERPLGETHRRLLQEALPEWGSVPFYKPKISTRVTPLLWERSEWGQVREYVLDHARLTTSFDAHAVSSVISRIDASEGVARDETFIQRFLWETTLSRYLDELAREVRSPHSIGAWVAEHGRRHQVDTARGANGLPAPDLSHDRH